jgi:hypothetical protein
MVYLDINMKNHKSNGKDLVKKLDEQLGNKNNKCFVIFYMEGCGPCNATRPEWNKMRHILNKSFLLRNDIIIASIDHKLAEGMKNVTSKPSGFPTMRFITDSGKTVENYEDSEISNKDRTIDSFIEWVKLKSGENNITNADKIHHKTHKKIYKGGRTKNNITRRKRGGKWSLKYKRSINCKKPKGFSQKQHCKYKYKK